MNRTLLLTTAAVSLVASLSLLVMTVVNSGSSLHQILFVGSAIFNGVALLIFLREIFSNAQLTTGQKNLWSIAVFVALGLGQLAYVLRHRPAVVANR
jgi:zinc transporter ZupT